jgi:hypothetical protein
MHPDSPFHAGAHFYTNGKKYLFNLELGNVRMESDNHPTPDFLTNAPQ